MKHKTKTIKMSACTSRVLWLKIVYRKKNEYVFVFIDTKYLCH